MPYTTLVSVSDAATHLGDPGWAFVDCRFVLGRPEHGREAYLARHIPGAVYADLERDLSGPAVAGRTGRHPLPDQAALDATFSRLGIGPETQVVAYDESTGAMAAARLWWLLRWASHDAVAVLDGGLSAWLAAGLPTASGEETRPLALFKGRYRPELVAGASEVLAVAGRSDGVLLDARTRDRFRGENETIDPVAGHIPGAVSMPYPDNLSPAGVFLSPERLAQRFADAARTAPPEATIVYCGSGVTAAHDVLACAHAGLGMPKLYAGSWSEWITDPSRPVATGE